MDGPACALKVHCGTDNIIFNAISGLFHGFKQDSFTDAIVICIWKLRYSYACLLFSGSPVVFFMCLYCDWRPYCLSKEQ